MRKRISVSLAQNIIDLSLNDIMNKDIATITGISESTVSRVLRQKDTYLDEETDWVFDKVIGKRCFDCGVIFVEQNGYPVLCKDCFMRRKLIGINTIDLTRYREI